MIQQEFAFMAERYDIFTDRLRPVSSDDMRVLEEVYRAYSRVRKLRRWLTASWITLELDAIHDDLKRRIIESDRPTSHDSH